MIKYLPADYNADRVAILLKKSSIKSYNFQTIGAIDLYQHFLYQLVESTNLQMSHVGDKYRIYNKLQVISYSVYIT